MLLTDRTKISRFNQLIIASDFIPESGKYPVSFLIICNLNARLKLNNIHDLVHVGFQILNAA